MSEDLESLFYHEKSVIQISEQIRSSSAISYEDLIDAYEDLSDEYKNLFSQSVKMTRISDSSQRKLLKVQLKLEEQNNQINSKNEELNTLNGTKDKFFSIISHDLRNPISSIMVTSDLVISNFSNFSTEEVFAYINKISTAIKSLHELFENLHRWSKTQTGTIEFEPANFDLNLVVDRIFSLLKTHSENKSIKLSKILPEESIVFGDVNMIETIIRNLTSNAIKFTNFGGEIKIILIQTSKFNKIIIEDNGVGMDEESKNKLFKINEKVTTIGTGKEVGSGLGLILSKEFVDIHNGNIWVESELNQGSRFIFRLPKQ
jgi:two-component system sensor histidine kinase/response regulator